MNDPRYARIPINETMKTENELKKIRSTLRKTPMKDPKDLPSWLNWLSTFFAGFVLGSILTSIEFNVIYFVIGYVVIGSLVFAVIIVVYLVTKKKVGHTMYNIGIDKVETIQAREDDLRKVADQLKP